MGVIGKVWQSLANLAASINGLAGVLDDAAGRLRERLALEAPEAPAPAVIDQPAAAPTGNGRGRKAVANGQ